MVFFIVRASRLFRAVLSFGSCRLSRGASFSAVIEFTHKFPLVGSTQSSVWSASSYAECLHETRDIGFSRARALVEIGRNTMRRPHAGLVVHQREAAGVHRSATAGR